MKFNPKDPIQDFFSDSFAFPQHVDMDSDNGDGSSLLLVSQDVTNFDSENSPSREIESSTNQNSVRVEGPVANQTKKRKRWQTIQGSDDLKQPRNTKQPVMVQYKNFLVNMKGPHFRWLQTDLGPVYHELVQNNLFLRTLRNLKQHMAMQDYEDVYKIEEIRESLAKCFRKGYLFRELMLSRIRPGNKKKFLKKIKLLERGFRTRMLRSLTGFERQRQEIQEGNIPQRSFVRQSPQGGGEPCT